MDRLGDSEPGKLPAHRVDVGRTADQAIAKVRRETLGLADQSRVDLRETGEPEIGRAEGDKLLRAGRRSELELGVERQDVEPSVEAALPRDDLAQPLAALAHQHPAAVPVDADEGRNEVWAHASENLDDACLIREERSVRLEPEIRGGRGHAHRRRPGTEV